MTSTFSTEGTVPVPVQVQDFMMQGGQGWGREVLALPECAVELSSAGLLVW